MVYWLLFVAFILGVLAGHRLGRWGIITALESVLNADEREDIGARLLAWNRKNR